jgi:hypothetical protein
VRHSERDDSPHIAMTGKVKAGPTGGGTTHVARFVVVRLARAGFADALNTHPMP